MLIRSRIFCASGVSLTILPVLSFAGVRKLNALLLFFLLVSNQQFHKLLIAVFVTSLFYSANKTKCLRNVNEFLTIFKRFHLWLDLPLRPILVT